MPDHSAADPQRRQEHRLERATPLLLSGAQHRSSRWPANADQCAIEPTESIQGKSAGRLGSIGISDVSRKRDGPVRSHLADCLRQQLGPSSDQHDMGALVNKLLSRCPPEPGAGGRHQEYTVGQPKIHQILTPVACASVVSSHSSRRARRSPLIKTTMPATAMVVNMNHWMAYQKCGPSESSGSWIGWKPPCWSGWTVMRPM